MSAGAGGAFKSEESNHYVWCFERGSLIYVNPTMDVLARKEVDLVVSHLDLDVNWTLRLNH